MPLQPFYPNRPPERASSSATSTRSPSLLEHNPRGLQVFLDKQVNLSRTAGLQRLATVATGPYYGDEELARWSFLLMRHNAVEGRKEMLSTRYGFTMRRAARERRLRRRLKGWTVRRPPRVGPRRRGSRLRQNTMAAGAGASGRHGVVMTRQATATTASSRPRRAECRKPTACSSSPRPRRRVARRHPRRYGTADARGR
jgi:hypothetical protein